MRDFIGKPSSKILNRQGYDVMPAEGPLQALEITTKKHPIDVVLSDIMMPGILGTNLVRQIAQMFANQLCVPMTGAVIDRTEVPQKCTSSQKALFHTGSDCCHRTGQGSLDRAVRRAPEGMRNVAELQQESRWLVYECDEAVRQSMQMVCTSCLERERRSKTNS